MCCYALAMGPNHYIFMTTVGYHIAQNFDGRNFDVFDAIQLDHQNLTHQIV